MKKLLIPALVLLLVFPACQPAPFSSLKPRTYQALQQKKGGQTIDVRTLEEFAAGHLADAQNSDWRGGQFVQDMQQWDKAKTYYLYCASGNRSSQAMQKMKEAGFTKVYNLGAFTDLKKADLPVED